jgi:triacylglycerol lipase
MTPIVLQHGLFGFGNFRVGNFRLSYFNGIDRALEKRGHLLIVSRVHPTGSIKLRAKQLKLQILTELRAQRGRRQKVIIFAHSMGGLDARYMISKLGMDKHVAALVTISTPHRGSAYADWCLRNLGKRAHGLQLAKLLKLDVDALTDLTRDQCAKFNELIQDSQDVKYFSLSAARPWHRCAPIFLHSHKIISEVEGENDGLVSVSSAQWGEHLETWPADHLHVINKRFVLELKNPTGNMTPRYMKVLDRLVKDGLCESCVV